MIFTFAIFEVKKMIITRWEYVKRFKTILREIQRMLKKLISEIKRRKIFLE